MPEDDKTHPIPDLTGYITEGQIILDRNLHRRGVYPPVAVLPSLSRLKQKGIGPGKTREDHADLSNQLFGAYARGHPGQGARGHPRRGGAVRGRQGVRAFADAFEDRFIRQGEHEDRSDRGDARDRLGAHATLLPRTELKRIKDEYVERYTCPVLPRQWVKSGDGRTVNRDDAGCG
jgi:V/A-type H+/Na+-transporting ATPase subunit B